MSAALLVAVLREPQRCETLSTTQWSALVCVARAERLLASLALQLKGYAIPADVTLLLDAAIADAEIGRAQALWEAEMARRALAPLGVPVVLLKGTAFVAAGLDAGRGRMIGDLDILVPRERLGDVEAALLAAGWDWVKPDPYDDAYYRHWMHELPPLIHRDRDRMIDVHHTILPLTARPTPDAKGLIDASVALENGLRFLSPEDMIVHAAAHLLADGDLSGGLRNLWDIDRLLREFDSAGFAERLRDRARHHALLPPLERALRLRGHLFADHEALRTGDWCFVARLLARDGWGRPTRPLLRLAFYLRSHWLRMPPLMLARHLWTKWRKG